MVDRIFKYLNPIPNLPDKLYNCGNHYSCKICNENIYCDASVKKINKIYNNDKVDYMQKQDVYRHYRKEHPFEYSVLKHKDENNES